MRYINLTYVLILFLLTGCYGLPPAKPVVFKAVVKTEHVKQKLIPRQALQDGSYVIQTDQRTAELFETNDIPNLLSHFLENSKSGFYQAPKSEIPNYKFVFYFSNEKKTHPVYKSIKRKIRAKNGIIEGNSGSSAPFIGKVQWIRDLNKGSFHGHIVGDTAIWGEFDLRLKTFIAKTAKGDEISGKVYTPYYDSITNREIMDFEATDIADRRLFGSIKTNMMISDRKTQLSKKISYQQILQVGIYPFDSPTGVVKNRIFFGNVIVNDPVPTSDSLPVMIRALFKNFPNNPDKYLIEEKISNHPMFIEEQ